MLTSSRVIRAEPVGAKWRAWLSFAWSEGARHKVLRWFDVEPGAGELAAVVAEIEAGLAKKEARRVVTKAPEVFPALVWATKAQVGAALRDRYRVAEGPEALRLAAALKRWYDAGAVTNAQIDALFGTTAATRPALLARVQAKAAAHAELLAARGE